MSYVEVINALSFNGQNGYALKFDGNNDWISYSTGVIPSQGDFTVELWTHALPTTGNRTLISQGSSGNAFYLGYESIYNRMRIGDGGLSTVYFPFNKWVHIAIVKTSTNTCLYTNGILADIINSPIPNPIVAFFSIGKQYGSYEEFFYGYIDELRVWNFARTQSEIIQTMTNYLSGTEQGLVGYWRFNEGDGVILNDLSQFRNHGTLLNGPLWVGTITPNYVQKGIAAQYVLNIEITKTNAPSVLSASVPKDGKSINAVVNRISLSFDCAMSSELIRWSKVKIFGGANYLLTETAQSWINAEYEAQMYGGHFVSINSEAENEFIKNNFIRNNSVWIALTDEYEEGNFKWINGEPLNFTRWNSDEPNNSGGNENYVEMLSSGFWNDLPFLSLSYGVIEITGDDLDGDSIITRVDPFPNNPYNGFIIQNAGVDNIFGTPDDIYY